MAILSKGTTLSYKASADAADFTVLADLQDVPELGGDSEAVEITTLADAAHMYMDGLISYGDSLAFTFLYTKEQFNALQALEGTIKWKVSLPDDTNCSFDGIASVKLNAVAVNTPITYTLSIKPSSEMVWA